MYLEHTRTKVLLQFKDHCSYNTKILQFNKTAIHKRAISNMKLTENNVSHDIYLRFTGVKALFKSVLMYLVHFSTALGLLMNGLVTSLFLSISAAFCIHIFTSIMPDISFPCVPPKIATRLASCKHEILVRELIAMAAWTCAVHERQSAKFPHNCRRRDVTAVYIMVI